MIGKGNVLNVKNKLGWFFGLILIGVLTVLYIYIYKFGSLELSNDLSTWSNFANYFGGLISPFLYFASILVLAYTLIKQVELKQNEQYSSERKFLLDHIYQNASYRKDIISGAKIDGKSISDDLKDIIKSIEELDEDEFPEEDEALKIFVHEINCRIKLTKYISVLTSLISVVKQIVKSELDESDQQKSLDSITSLISNEERVMIIMIYAFNIFDILGEENHKYLKIEELNIMRYSNAYTTDESEREGELIPPFIIKRFSNNFFPLIPLEEIT